MWTFGLHADFGGYVVRFIAKRLVGGSRTRPDLYSDFSAGDLPSGPRDRSGTAASDLRQIKACRFQIPPQYRGSREPLA